MEIPIDPSYTATAGGYYATAYVSLPFPLADGTNACSLCIIRAVKADTKVLASSAQHGSSLNVRTAGFLVASAVVLVTLGAGR